MKAIIPKPWERLPKSQKEAVADYLKRLFHRQSKMVKDGSQAEYLDRRMAEIFKKGGFPEGFFEKLLGPVEKGADNEQREAETT